MEKKSEIFIKLIADEIMWCRKNPQLGISSQQQASFIDGLKQAALIIKMADEKLL